MKKSVLFLSLLTLINLVSAHTGNDYYEHGPELADWIIGLSILVALVILIIWLIKRKKRKNRK